MTLEVVEDCRRVPHWMTIVATPLRRRYAHPDLLSETPMLHVGWPLPEVYELLETTVKTNPPPTIVYCCTR